MSLNKLANFCSVGLIVSISACAWSETCHFPQFEGEIERTIPFVEHAAPMVEMSGVLMGSMQRTCVVASFDISASGEAEDIRLEATGTDGSSHIEWL